MTVQGWGRDPSGAHEDRWFSAGQPTPLVRDGGVVSREDLPPEQQPGRPPERREPADPAVAAAQRQRWAAKPDWPYPAVAWRCAMALAVAAVILAWSLHSQPASTFELAGAAVAWDWAGRAAQAIACLAAAAALIATAQRPRWRQAAALGMTWGIVPLQIGFSLLAGSQYPGNSCTGQPGWAAITLSYGPAEPGSPVATVPAGAHVIVNVPAYPGEPVGDISTSSGIVHEDCTVSLPGGGRRAVVTALRPGTASIVADQSPSPFFAPAWIGQIIVQKPRA